MFAVLWSQKICGWQVSLIDESESVVGYKGLGPLKFIYFHVELKGILEHKMPNKPKWYTYHQCIKLHNL